MTNRKLSSPILSALVLALAVGSPSVGQAQVPNAGYSAPVTQPAPAPVASGATAATPTKHTASYTVVKGDSLTSIARKFNTTRKKLRDLNELPASVTTVKPGDLLLVPATPVSRAAAAAATAKVRRELAMAQPVQDFDVPASTFGSCPVPLPTPGDDPQPTAPVTASAGTPGSDSAKNPAPIAKLVSPAEMAADQQQPEVEIITPTTPKPTPAPPRATALVPQIVKAQPTLAPVPSISTSTYNSSSSSRPVTSFSTGAATTSVRPIPAPSSSTTKFTRRGGLMPGANSNSGATPTAATGDWGARFFQQARYLGNQGIAYDDDWRPPGESRSWVMDCSNTSRYLYKVTTGLQLPRTASDQYYYLHLQGKAWDAPLNSQGFVDTEFLRRNLKAGDLLFWENTYRPERQPPITHVMVYLGVNEKGEWIMAGSQSSRGGEHNRRNGGPDIYIFRPSQPCGGYTTWLGMVHHQGRFCAYGRPLEADPTKLSVAANE